MPRYIDADKFIEFLNTVNESLKCNPAFEENIIANNITIVNINHFGTEDVQEVVYGEWEIKLAGSTGHNTKIQCSSCKREVTQKENYCPDCGRNMKESKALADTVTNKDLAYGLINLSRVTRTNLLVKFGLITNEEIKDDIPHVKIIQKIIDRVDDKNCRAELMQKIREA